MERIVGSMLPIEKKLAPSAQNLDLPCREVAYIYKSMCWRNQVTTWMSFFGGNTIAVGTRCQGIEPEFQKLCFETVGLNIAMIPKIDKNQIAAMCAFIGQNYVSDDCAVGAMKELLFENKAADIAGSLCQIVSPQTQQSCFSLYSQLKAETQVRFSKNSN